MQNLKMRLVLLTLIILVGFLGASLAFSPLITNVVIRSGGNILIRVLFDKCDFIGDWKVSSPSENILEVDMNDKVEGNGSLKGTFAAIRSNQGASFYKRPAGQRWDFSRTPLMRVWIKIHQTMPSQFRFEIVTSEEWNVFYYEILDQLTVGEWCEVTIDMRLPDGSSSSERLPDLTYVRQIDFACWTEISQPLHFNWDNVTLASGPIIPIQAVIVPSWAAVLVGDTVTFQVGVLGGTQPYSYAWYVNGTLQRETSASFSFTPNAAGIYEVICNITDAKMEIKTVNATLAVFIPSQGFPPSIDVFKSEVRAMFIHTGWYMTHNFTLIAETCKNWGINSIFIQISKGYIWDYGANTVKFYQPLATAVNIFKSYGFNVHVLLVVGYQNVPENMRALTSSGLIDWVDFCKPEARQMLVDMVTSLATNYNIDGICYDYIRWDFREDMPLGEEAKQQFMNDTGITNINWPSDVLQGGAYYWNFTDWRHKPITETVRLMTQAIRQANPNINVSAAVINARFGEDYLLWRIGQNTPEWVEKDYVDFLCIMQGYQYTQRGIEWSWDYYLGGVPGKIPCIPFIYVKDGERTVDPSEMVQLVQMLRNYGIYNWVMWHYGGPGWGGGSGNYPDVRPYLAALKRAGFMEEPIWAIQNFTVTINGNSVIVSWTTTKPTIGRLEYAEHPLYTAQIRYSSHYRNYWKDIEYVGDSTIIEDEEPKMEHSFTILMTAQLEIRIQSIDINGVTVTTRTLSVVGPKS